MERGMKEKEEGVMKKDGRTNEGAMKQEGKERWVCWKKQQQSSEMYNVVNTKR